MRETFACPDEFVTHAERSREPFDPEVTLFVDESAESQEAIRLLDGAGEKVRTLSADGERVPVAVFGGSAYDGIGGIHELVQELTSFDRAVIEAYQRHVSGANEPGKTAAVSTPTRQQALRPR